jgi:hypothetical protein
MNGFNAIVYTFALQEYNRIARFNGYLPTDIDAGCTARTIQDAANRVRSTHPVLASTLDDYARDIAPGV